MAKRLQGKVAVITAAGHGIGRAIAEAFVAEGATVYATDLDKAKLEGIARAKKMKLDVRSTKAVEAFAAQDIGTDPDYRRQADGIAAALDVVDSALRLRDGALLDRVLTDLKTFDTQLSQRFGG